jgi:hypothetical protein
MNDGEGEVLLGFQAQAREISRLIGTEVTAKQAQHWSKRCVYRTRKVGHFRTATKSSIREDLSPATDAVK